MPLLASNAALQWRRLRRRYPAVHGVRRTMLLALGLVVAIIGIAVAASLLDARSLEWARSLSPGWRDFFRGVTRFGKSEWWLVPSAVAFLLLLAGDWRRVARPSARAWAEIGALVAFFFFAIAAAGLTTDLIKLVVGRARPALFGEVGHIAFNPFGAGYLHLSFPSGHATTVAAAATAVALLAPRAGMIAGFLALLVCISRVVVGAHYPSDVVGGALVGTSVPVLLAVAWSRGRFAFYRDGEGRLVARTAAIRRLARNGAPGALLDGLRRAWFG